ncbi:MAG: hypothetical protein KDJ29_04825 [Hyphomicrobiales bacterium]|nr:hypothetical protein [Hyphomicrobiales bacterium]
MATTLSSVTGRTGKAQSQPVIFRRAVLASGGAAFLAAAFALPALTTDAFAARCPSGQFYRVSKKICQDKSIGYKLGIFKRKGSAKAQRKAKATPPESVSPKPLSSKTVSSKSAAPEAASAPKPVAATPEPKQPGIEKPAPVAAASPEPATKATPQTGSVSAPAIKTPIIRMKKAAAPEAEKTGKTNKAADVATGNVSGVTASTIATGSNPLAAIAAATRPGSKQREAARLADKPLETRLVKATYFTANGALAQMAPSDSIVAKRAVLNLLKSRLHLHAERNRAIIIRRATAD